MELEELRTFTIEALQNFNTGNESCEGGSLQTLTLKSEINNIAVKNGHGKMTEGDETKVLEVINNLMIEGVIMWGRNLDSHESQAPFISITSYGKKVFQEGKIIPHDLDGYLNHFKNEIPNVDGLILMYLTESVQCFLRNNLIA